MKWQDQSHVEPKRISLTEEFLCICLPTNHDNKPKDAEVSGPNSLHSSLEILQMYVKLLALDIFQMSLSLWFAFTFLVLAQQGTQLCLLIQNWSKLEKWSMRCDIIKPPEVLRDLLVWYRG